MNKIHKILGLDIPQVPTSVNNASNKQLDEALKRHCTAHRRRGAKKIEEARCSKV